MIYITRVILRVRNVSSYFLVLFKNYYGTYSEIWSSRLLLLVPCVATVERDRTNECELMKPLATKASTTPLPAVAEISLCRNQDKTMYSAHDSARVLTMGKASPETLSPN
jgi:hypothetical protein